MATNLKQFRFGGNSYGVCRGLDQGGKLTKSTYPKLNICIMLTWALILVINDTPGCVITSDQKQDEKS